MSVLALYWKEIATGVAALLLAITAAYRVHRKGYNSGLAVGEDAIKRNNGVFLDQRSRYKAPTIHRIEAPTDVTSEDIAKIHDEVNKL